MLIIITTNYKDKHGSDIRFTFVLYLVLEIWTLPLQTSVCCFWALLEDPSLIIIHYYVFQAAGFLKQFAERSEKTFLFNLACHYNFLVPFWHGLSYSHLWSQ
jgi:hypothetical protein